MKPIQYTGVWWLPADTSTQLHGTLEGDGRSQAKLTLVGTFPIVASQGGIFRADVIHGYGRRGEHLTLCNNLCTSSTMLLSGGIPGSAFSVGLVVIGQHFDSMEEVRFTSVTATLQHLGDWTGFDPVSVIPVPESSQGPPGFDLSLRHLRPLNFKAGDIEIALGVDWEQEIRPTVRHRITLTHWMRLKPPKAIGLDECLKLVYRAQTFLAFGLRWPTQPDDVRCHSTKTAEKKADVHLHYGVALPRLATTFRELPMDRCFQAQEIVDTLPENFGKWLVPALDIVRSLFFSRMYAEAIYMQHDYLTLVQAIEAFHREFRGGRFLTRPQWKEARRALWTALDQASLPLTSEEREKVRQRLSHVAEHNLGSRLASLLEELKDYTEVFISDKVAFIKDVLRVRNYWTHYDSNRAAGQLDENEVHILTERLEALMELCLMNHVDIPSAVMASVALRCKESVDEFIRLNRPNPQLGSV
jgi:hypothetical protein